MNSRRLLYVSFFLLFLFYLAFESRVFLFGPELSLPYASSITTSEKIFTLKGKANPVNNVFINAQEVPIDSAGNFSFPLALHTGVNDITVSAKNRYDKETVKTLRIIAR